MFLLVCRLGFWRARVGAPDPDLTYMGPPLNRVALKGLTADDAWDRYTMAAIPSDSTDHKVSKLAMDPVSHTRRMDPLTAGLEMESLDEAPFGADVTVATGVIRDSGSCCRASSFFERKRLLLLIWSWHS